MITSEKMNAEEKAEKADQLLKAFMEMLEKTFPIKEDRDRFIEVLAIAHLNALDWINKRKGKVD